MRRIASALVLATIAALGSAQEAKMPLAIREVKAKYERDLLAKPGVVSVGIGRDAEGRDVIFVGLDRERPQTRAALPQVLDGYPVRIEVVGSPRAQ